MSVLIVRLAFEHVRCMRQAYGTRLQKQRNNFSHFLKKVNKFCISKLSIFLKKYQSSSATILEIHI